MTPVPCEISAPRAARPDDTASLSSILEHLRSRGAEVATDGIVISDATLSGEPIIYASPEFYRLTGYSESAVIGRNCRFLQGPDTCRDTVAEIRRRLAARQPFRGEILNYRRGGEPFWNELRIEPLYDDGGEVRYFVGVQSDVSARKRIELALRRYKYIFDATSDGCCFVDLNYTVCEANRALATMMDRPVAAIVGQPLAGLLGTDAFVVEAKPRIDALIAGAATPARWELKTRRGRCFDARGDLIRDDDDTAIGIAVRLCDVTAQKQSERSLRQYETVIEQTSDMVCIVGTDFRYRSANRCYAELYGRAQTELIGRPVNEVVGDDAFYGYIRCDLGRCFNGEQVRCQRAVVVADGQLYLDIVMSPLREHGGGVTAAVVTIRDVSDQQRFADALRHSEERFRDFAEVAADWFWETDADGRFTYLSDSHALLWPGAPHASLGHTWDSVAAGRIEQPQIRARVADCQRRRQAYDVSYDWRDLVGARRRIHLSAKPVFLQDGRFSGYRNVAKDVTESYRLSQKLNYQASHDELTGLPNRRDFNRRLREALRTAGERPDAKRLALCYLDLDQFKIVNDSAGHAAGDRLLIQVSRALADGLRDGDLLARLGGDEFALLLWVRDLDDAQTLVERLLDTLRGLRFVCGERCFEVSASAGLVAAGDDSPETLMKRADLACYAAKDLGRNRLHTFHEHDGETARRRADINRVASIRSALENDRFCLFAQPIRPLVADLEPHYEILLRLREADGTLLPPGSFIPAAERFGMMGAIDRWVIDTALSRYRRLFADEPTPRLALNLSGNSFSDDTLLDFVRARLARHRVPAGHICFEITETAMISHIEQAGRFVGEMKKLGCRFALDDFGSGLSSFGYLKRFAVDYLKIDGCFVRDILRDPTDRAVVTMVREFGRQLGIRTVAEFVENDAVLAALREIGVDYGQGYALGRPFELPACV